MKQLTLLALVLLLSKPFLVFALALSDLELQSHLNQRLSARIALTDVPTGEIGDLNIKVRKTVDELSPGRQVVLQHEVVAEGSKYYLSITSRDVIREPILSIVVELDWSSGHLLRNYALIIDPQ